MPKANNASEVLGGRLNEMSWDLGQLLHAYLSNPHSALSKWNKEDREMLEGACRVVISGLNKSKRDIEPDIQKVLAAWERLGEM